MEKSKEGFTDHEVLLEIRDDLKQHIKNVTACEKQLREEVSKRPTRGEIMVWLGVIVTISGLVIRTF